MKKLTALFLSLLLVLRSCIYMKLLNHRSSQRSLWKHSLNSQLNNAFWLLLHHLCQSSLFHSANIVRVIVIYLLAQFFTSYFNFLSVNYDYVVTCINMRCKFRFILSS